MPASEWGPDIVYCQMPLINSQVASPLRIVDLLAGTRVPAWPCSHKDARVSRSECAGGRVLQECSMQQLATHRPGSRAQPVAPAGQDFAIVDRRRVHVAVKQLVRAACQACPQLLPRILWHVPQVEVLKQEAA